MAVSPARAAAFDILLRVAEQDAYASELLHSDRLNQLSTANRALATELVMGVIRWQSWLDEVLRPAITDKLEKLDAEVLIALRLGAYQLGFLERVPAHAAVNDAVELVKRARRKFSGPLVNAVLRRLSRERTRLRPAPLDPASIAPDELARRTAHPPWLVERWAAHYGAADAAAICAWDQCVPPTAIRLPADKQTAAALEQELRTAGVELELGALLSGARRVKAGQLTRTAAFREGRAPVQDEASQLVALLAAGGGRILDCCAAPGGKTALIAERSPQARIVAVDVHAQRARRLRQRVRHANVEVITADARALPLTGQFDTVLADVPCSGTGTLARHPEIKWRLRLEQLTKFQQLQAEILAAAMARAAPGGRVIYASCSLQAEENEQVVERALREQPGFRLLAARDELERLQQAGELAWRDVDSLVSDSFLRTLPGVHPCDGFFAVVMQKSSD